MAKKKEDKHGVEWEEGPRLRDLFKKGSTQGDVDKYKEAKGKNWEGWKSRHWMASGAGSKAVGAGKAVGGVAKKGAGAAVGVAGAAGGAAAGGIKSWWNKSPGESKGVALFAIFTLAIGMILWFLLLKAWFPWYIILAVCVYIIFMRWLYVKSKESKGAKLAFWLIIIVLIAVILFWSLGTGRGKQFWSTLALSDDDLGAMGALDKNFWEYIWNCKILATRGCEIAAMKGDTGGIFIQSLDPEIEEFEAKEDYISLIGYEIGKSWTTRTDAKAPDIRNVDVSASVTWKDEELNALYPNQWSCEQPRGANSDFYCYHPAISLEPFYHTKEVVCGTPWINVRKGESAYVNCPAIVTLDYAFSTGSFRWIKFARDVSQVSFAGVPEENVSWSTQSPVVLTIGSNRKWNMAIRPVNQSIRLTVSMSNNLPQEFAAYAGGTYENIAAELGTLKLRLTEPPGITVECKNPGERTKVGDFVYCTHEFTGEDRELVGLDREKYNIVLKFDPGFDPGMVMDYQITGDITYKAKVSKDIRFKIGYVVE